MDIDLFDNEVQFLEDLASDLADTLAVIAFAGHADNVDYIRSIQEHLRKTYESRLPDCITMTSCIKVQPVYDTIMDLISMNPEERRQAAEEAFYRLISAEDT